MNMTEECDWRDRELEAKLKSDSSEILSRVLEVLQRLERGDVKNVAPEAFSDIVDQMHRLHHDQERIVREKMECTLILCASV